MYDGVNSLVFHLQSGSRRLEPVAILGMEKAHERARGECQIVPSETQQVPPGDSSLETSETSYIFPFLRPVELLPGSTSLVRRRDLIASHS
jgi:hypothetical protein